MKSKLCKADKRILKAFIIIMSISFFISGFCTAMSTSAYNYEAVTIENELLKTELSEYDNTEEIFPNYCIKCYCKNICQEAANELKEKKGDELND